MCGWCKSWWGWGKCGSIVGSVEGLEGVEMVVGIDGVMLVLGVLPTPIFTMLVYPKKDLGVRVD